MKRRFFVPWSKVLTASVMALVIGFIIWACCEMHRLDDLSPLAFIGASIIGMGATIITAYMWRAKQKDLYELDLKKTEEMAKLRQQYGDDLKSEKVQQPGQGDYSSGWGGGSVWGGSGSDDGMVG